METCPHLEDQVCDICYQLERVKNGVYATATISEQDVVTLVQKVKNLEDEVAELKATVATLSASISRVAVLGMF